MRIGNKRNGSAKRLLGCVVALACLSTHQLKAAEVITMSPANTATAHEGCCMDDNVHMRFGIPLWAFSMNGDIAVGDRQGHVDKDFWNFFDKLDFIAPISVELRKSRFYFHTEVIYVKSSQDLEPRGLFAGSGANGDLTTKQIFGGVNLGYELVRQPCYSLTAFAGGRGTYVDAKLNINAPGVGVSASASKSKFIGDPIVGLYGTWDFTKSLGVYVKGDVGGFGLIGDHFTWQVEPGAEWRISPHTYARVEWRCLSIDFSKSNFNYDMQFMGPQAEIGWRF
jgi:hypothetical protein